MGDDRDDRAMDLTPLMKPASIAVVGASARMGRGTRVVANLQQFGYRGRVFPVNPKYGEILGLPCYPDLLATPEPAELVVVAIPAADVPALLAEAAARGTRAAIILSSGFGEAGPDGRERQGALDRLVAEHGLLICGPNCYGVFDVRGGSATFSADFTAPPPAGGVAVVSQSGGFSHAIAEALSLQRAARAVLHRVVRQPGRRQRGGLPRVPRGGRPHAGDRRVRRGLPAPREAPARGCAGARRRQAHRGSQGRPVGERASGHAEPHRLARRHARDRRRRAPPERRRDGVEPQRDDRHADAPGRAGRGPRRWTGRRPQRARR